MESKNINSVFGNIDNSFKSIIKQDEEIYQILEKIKNTNYQPKDIFRWAKYPIGNVKVIIIGQDPYPNKNDADGLCFSSNAKECPVSLNRIFNVIGYKPKKYTLDHWAMQGFLLLNTSLTVEIDKPNSHKNLWQNYTNKLFKNIAEQINDECIICLWGSEAHNYEKIFNIKNHQILKWCHPVAMVSPSFSKCNHFEIIKQKYNIEFDYNKCYIDIFTDGCCKNNQNKKLAKAGWGLYIYKTNFVDYENTIYYGTVNGNQTNIRAEGLALYNAFKICEKCRNVKINIFTDSKFWIQMINEFMPNWDDDKFDKKSNPDLTKKIWKLYSSLKTKPSLIFVNAYHDYTPKNDEEKYKHYGNMMAEYASELILQ